MNIGKRLISFALSFILFNITSYATTKPIITVFDHDNIKSDIMKESQKKPFQDLKAQKAANIKNTLK